MNYYKPKRLRWGRVAAGIIRGIAGILMRWPLLLFAAFILSPISPHMLIQYTYEQRGTHRHMFSCEYLGSRGFIDISANGDCPLFTIIDRRRMQKQLLEPFFDR